MSSSSASVATPTKSSFNRRVEEVEPSKADINRVIMEYLISEGYPKAAQKFASEANIQHEESMQSFRTRVAIKNFIISGRIEDAMESINDLNPEILDTNPELHFALLRLQLIEMVREGDPNTKEDLMRAITFANRQLAPRAKGNKQFVEDLERGMALLIFPNENLPPVLKPLLEPSLRQDIASQVNDAILQSHGSHSETRIKNLIKLRQWAEEKCRDMKKQLPSILRLGLTAEDIEAESESQSRAEVHGNGEADAMVH